MSENIFNSSNKNKQQNREENNKKKKKINFNQKKENTIKSLKEVETFLRKSNRISE